MRILTGRNEREEEDLRPDVIDNSSLESLPPRERALEEGILRHHDARAGAGVRGGKVRGPKSFSTIDHQQLRAKKLTTSE